MTTTTATTTSRVPNAVSGKCQQTALTIARIPGAPTMSRPYISTFLACPEIVDGGAQNAWPRRLDRPPTSVCAGEAAARSWDQSRGVPRDLALPVTLTVVQNSGLVMRLGCDCNAAYWGRLLPGPPPLFDC